jgi:hypothetical protein
MDLQKILNLFPTTPSTTNTCPCVETKGKSATLLSMDTVVTKIPTPPPLLVLPDTPPTCLESYYGFVII